MNRRLLTARWVLPVSSAPLRDGGVLIDARGQIEAVGAAGDLRSDNVEQLDFGQAAILPGLINVHAHPELAAFRGLLDDLPFHIWIPTLMKCKRGANLDHDDFIASAEWTCAESLRAGITTMGATETSGAALAALSHSGMRGRVYLETFGPAPAQVTESVAELRARLQQFAGKTNQRVRLGVSPHAPYSVSDALYLATAALARAESLPLATHAAEAETEELLVSTGTGPFAAGLRARGIETPPRARSTIELLHRLGVLATQPLLIHCVRLSDADLGLIADSGSSIAHCPVANARLGHGIARIVEAREAGINVAIGTDSVASNNRIDVLEEARIAQIAQRGRLQATGALPADQLLRMVTLDAARALGMDRDIGSLESGKQADLCVIALDRVHTVPAPAPHDAVFHAARGSDVRLTMVEGRIVYNGERVLTLEESRLQQQMLALSDRLLAARESI